MRAAPPETPPSRDELLSRLNVDLIRLTVCNCPPPPLLQLYHLGIYYAGPIRVCIYIYICTKCRFVKTRQYALSPCCMEVYMTYLKTLPITWYTIETEPSQSSNILQQLDFERPRNPD